MNDPKVIAFYLPQFHSIPENDEWWGQGFTEWTNVKKTLPLFEGHYQPVVPLNENYYDLSDIDVMKWQSSIAKKYGIYGFCFYHYWFGGKKLLQKPIENFLDDKSIDQKFCLCWANENWTRCWDGTENEILIAQNYGVKEEWASHFQYLLNYFKDPRYIFHEDKPLLVIYKPELMPDFDEMIAFWQQMSIESGLKGISITSQYNYYGKKSPKSVDYDIYYQPAYLWNSLSKKRFSISTLKYFTSNISLAFNLIISEYIRKKNSRRNKNDSSSRLLCLSYDLAWKSILRLNYNENVFPGCFSNWDNSPRKGNRAIIFRGGSPEKFYKYFSRFIKICKKRNKEKVFIMAWNEWAEGGYLEPDSRNGFGYLEAIRKSLVDNGVFPFD